MAGDAREHRRRPEHREHRYDTQEAAMRASGTYQVAEYCSFCESWYLVLHPALVQARRDGVLI